MQLRPSLIWAFYIFLVSSVVLASLAAHAKVEMPQKTLVEVWCGGDDGLTERLCDSIELQFKSSPYFQMSAGKKPGTLIVSIPTNVMWKEKKGRVEVFYTVQFSLSDGKLIGASKGTCWEDDLNRCAGRVLAGTEKVVERLRH